jgi:uncharacterized membrane protein YeaQ/YmgE (transglycosylase-associated protein family)
VSTHLADTGENPVETFGSPATYAEAYLAASQQGRSSSWRGPWWAARFVAFVAGMWLLRAYGLDVQTWPISTTLTWGTIAYLVVLGLVGALVSRWLLRPWAERQASHSPTASVAIPPRALVLGGLATVMVGPMLVPQRGNTLGVGAQLAPSGPVWSLALLGVVLTLGAVWTEVRSAKVLDPRTDA